MTKAKSDLGVDQEKSTARTEAPAIESGVPVICLACGGKEYEGLTGYIATPGRRGLFGLWRRAAADDQLAARCVTCTLAVWVPFRAVTARLVLGSTYALVRCGQPFGFTREDVIALRQTGWPSHESIADRIEALLPPV